MKKSKLELWIEVIKKAPPHEKAMAILFGWIFILTAHDPDDNQTSEE